MEETVYVQLINKMMSRWNGLNYSIVAAEVILLSEEEAQLSLDWLNNSLTEDNHTPSYIQKYLHSFSMVSLLRSNLGYGSF